MAYVDFNRSLTEAEALKGNKDTIYFTTDTQCLIMGGKVYGIGHSRLFIGSQSEYELKATSGQIPYGTIVIIEEPELPDVPEEDVTTAETTAILGLAVLGKMILGQE